MPLNRYQIRNEYSLADPELYKVADKDDPEALLEGVAMAGLVGVLRQLGDLAEFAAEIFHDLHEEVMATAARGHGLIVRVQQLESDFPSIERTLLSQTSHTSFLYNTGVDWHSNLRMDQSVVTQGDLPRFVMDSYEECRGPPRLFLLDKFDVAGAGACLKRFTDPSFFKLESTSSTGRNLDRQREKKSRRVKKRGPRWRNGDTPESFPSSHAKLHQLFLEERIESGINDPVSRAKLKKRQFTGSLFDQDQDNGRSYMEKFLDTSSQEQKVLHEICIDPLALTWTSDNACEASPDIVEIGTISPIKESIQTDRSLCSLPDARETLVKLSLGDFNQDTLNLTSDNKFVEVPRINHESRDGNVSINPKLVSGEEIADRESMSETSVGDACDFDDGASEMDNYVDALANIESEVETDSDSKKNSRYSNLKPIMADSDGSERQREFNRVSLDSQSFGNSITSEDGDHFSKEARSSCSNSVNTLMETTPDLDAAAADVTTVEAFNSDADNILFDHDPTSEAAIIIHPEVHDILKSEQEFGEASNTSSLADLNKEVLPVDIEASLKENPLPDLEPEGLTDQTGILPSLRKFSDTFEDSGNFFSVKPSIPYKECQNSSVYSDMPRGLSNVSDFHDSACPLVARHDKISVSPGVDACSDSGLSGKHLPYPERTKSIYVTREEDYCFPSTEKNSKDLFSALESFASFETQELLPGTTKSGCTSSLGYAEANFPSSWESPISKDEAAEHTEGASFKADIAVASSRDESSKEITGSADNILNDSLMLGKPSSTLDPLETQNEWLKIPSEATNTTLLGPCQDEACEQYSSNNTECSVYVGGNRDQIQAFEPDALVNGLESQAATIHGVASVDCAPIDQQGNEDEIFSHDASPLNIPYKHTNDSDFVLVAENGLNSDHDVEKVERIVTGADGPRQADAKDDYQQNGVIMLSSLSLHPEKLHEPPLLVTEQFYQDEELTKGYRRALTEQRQINHVRDASSANMCNMSSDGSSSLILLDDSLPEDVKNNRKLAAEAEDVDPLSHDLLEPQYVERSAGVADDDQPTVSKTSLQSAEHTLETSNVEFHGNGMLSGGNQFIQLENSCQPLCQQLPDLGIRPAEPRINLEPPSLPPLPPMQWRLGRFQNSAAVPAGRQMVQHTRVPVQVQPMSLPTMHHTLAPVQSMSLPAVHHTIASLQPVTIVAGNNTLAPLPPTILPMAPPEVHYTFGPLQPVTVPTSNYGTETIARTLSSEGQLGYSDGYVAQQGVFTLPMPVGASEGLFQINTSAVGRQDNLPSKVPLMSTNLDANVTQQGIFMPSNSVMVSEDSSQTRTSENGRQAHVPFTVSPASTSPKGTLSTEESLQPNVDPLESGSLVEGHLFEHTSTVEAKVKTETFIQNEPLRHDNQVFAEEVVNSNIQSVLSSAEDLAPPGLVALEAYDGIPTYADGDTNETLQKKPPRPRNPLIVEVVAIDKSKLRKVERTKSPLKSKTEGGESLLEQRQLRKVERVKPSAESKVEGGEYLLEQLQLRKVGERVKPPVEQKAEEEFLEQLQLRKVGERVKPPVEQKSEEREFLLEQLQLRKVGEKTQQEVEPKVEESESPLAHLRKVRERVREELELKAEETESPRMQLRKVTERAHPPAVQKAEERDSLFEQIRNKSFNLKPAVAARPNIQGPRTNLKVAAILEKASTIRQAMAGSDEEDDADSWSDN
ncbi:hypothetical protein SOVF_177270 [Spinacia oleracea]|nr:hypothetical protein SOVF_177270 [Spinacia oleracea]